MPPLEIPGGPLALDRSRLPIAAYKEEVLKTVRTNQVTVLQGDTGCGKTTQVPQFILEEAAESGQAISIVCTQPRRISAMGVAERVAAERGEPLARTVGYSIRLENKSSPATRLLFARLAFYCAVSRRTRPSGHDPRNRRRGARALRRVRLLTDGPTRHLARAAA